MTSGRTEVAIAIGARPNGRANQRRQPRAFAATIGGRDGRLRAPHRDSMKALEPVRGYDGVEARGASSSDPRRARPSTPTSGQLGPARRPILEPASTGTIRRACKPRADRPGAPRIPCVRHHGSAPRRHPCTTRGTRHPSARAGPWYPRCFRARYHTRRLSLLALKERHTFGPQSDIVGSTEYRDGYYAASPGSALETRLAAVDFATDPFYAAPPAVAVDASAFSCTMAADVAVAIDFANPAGAAVRAKCEARLYDRMHFCHDDPAVSSAQAALLRSSFTCQAIRAFLTSAERPAGARRRRPGGGSSPANSRAVRKNPGMAGARLLSGVAGRALLARIRRVVAVTSPVGVIRIFRRGR